MNNEYNEYNEDINNSENVDRGINSSAALDTAKQYFIELSNRAIELKEQVDNSQTETKRKYYSNKLEKNNDEAIRVLIMIEKLSIIRSINDESEVVFSENENNISTQNVS